MSHGCIACQYCNKTFKRANDLIRHQETTKYCLKIQGKIVKEPSETFICNGCGRNLSNKYNLKRHEKSCVHMIEDRKYNNLKKELVGMIKETSQNVLVNNLQPITDEHIKEHLAHLSLNFINDGAKGFANFANEYPLKNLIVCTDRSRKKLHYKLDDGVITDYGIKLTQQFFQSIAEKNKELINGEYNNIQDELQSILSSSNFNEDKLMELMKKATSLQETLMLCEQAASGSENKLTDGFLSQLVKII